jgi:4-hydroxy-4-methyl-2-oxoglutarate aldolase
MNDAAPGREAIRVRFLKVDTSNVADVLDDMGLPHQGLAADFKPFPESAGKLAGSAYTIRGQMTPYAGKGDPEKMKACQGLAPGDVSVWSGDGEGICYFGELIAVGMKDRGSVGALVDGGIRDIRWIGALGFSVYARYRTPVQSIGRWKVVEWQQNVYLRGATAKWVLVSPGDFILADEDGAIVIPQAVVSETLGRAEQLTEQETKLRLELQNGLGLEQALAEFGHV